MMKSIICSKSRKRQRQRVKGKGKVRNRKRKTNCFNLNELFFLLDFAPMYDLSGYK